MLRAICVVMLIVPLSSHPVTPIVSLRDTSDDVVPSPIAAWRIIQDDEVLATSHPRHSVQD
jgi:hypothetical protein